MAIAITNISRDVNGKRRKARVTFTGPASYTTNGEVLTLAQLQQIMAGDEGKISAVDFTKISEFEGDDNVGGQYPVLDKAGNKMQIMAAGAEVANATNLSAISYSASFYWGGQDQ